MNSEYSEPVSVTRDYYNSDQADRFYYNIWGGEDIHIGLYESPEESIYDASHRTVAKMASLIPPPTSETKMLDLGAGYGGAARFLAKKFGCHVSCLNLSEVQNQRDREMNKAAGLESKIEVVDGDFEAVPYPENSFDIVWSQDSFLHSGNREKVFEEIDRVVKPGGYIIFTDPMQSDDCPPDVLTPVLERIHLKTMGSPGFYRQVADRLGWEEVLWEDHSQQLPRHYQRVHDELTRREEEVKNLCTPEFIDRMKTGLQHWVKTGQTGYLRWGFFVFRKKDRGTAE